MTKRFFKTTIVFEVLSEDEPLVWETLADLHYAVTEGHCSGHLVTEGREEIDETTLVSRCAVHGTDPSFFLDPENDDGEDEKEEKQDG
jgi:predicted transcriptional regulator YdeE